MLKRIGQVILWAVKASVIKRQEDKGDFQETISITEQHWRADWLKWVPEVEYPLIGVRNGSFGKIAWAIEDKAEGRRKEVQFVSGTLKQQETACHRKQLHDG